MHIALVAAVTWLGGALLVGVVGAVVSPFPLVGQRLRDLFGRHVGTTVAQQALVTGVSLGGELRTVAALFVDIAGSTSLVRRTGHEEMVGLLNRSFAVVVETVEAEGGLVDEFEGDAVPCAFGAPADHPDPAGAALRAAGARQRCRRRHGCGDEELHWAPDGVVELRGRDEPTRTWVLTIG